MILSGENLVIKLSLESLTEQCPPLVLKPGVDVIIREKRLVIVYQYSDLSLPGYSWLDRAEVIIMNSG